MAPRRTKDQQTAVDADARARQKWYANWGGGAPRKPYTSSQRADLRVLERAKLGLIATVPGSENYAEAIASLGYEPQYAEGWRQKPSPRLAYQRKVPTSGTHKASAEINVTPKFEKWAKGFSGCDGGNLRGSIWLCGIEWGLGDKHELAEELERPVSKPPQRYKRPADVLGGPKGKYPFNEMFLKLTAAMRGGSVQDYKRIAFEEPFPFHRRSDFFKLNVFPIAFKKIKQKHDPRLWFDKYGELTGLSTADQYIDWCRANRFPAIRSWVKRGRPRLIICVGGSKEFRDDFQKAFGFDGKEHEEDIQGKKLVWVSKSRSVLATVPYSTSPSGINSNPLMQAFGERLGEILDGRG